MFSRFSHIVGFIFSILAFMICGLTVANAAKSKGLHIFIDRAKVLNISHKSHTLAIGNPAIADATLLDNNTVVITGRSYGVTNLIILDLNKKIIADMLINVTADNNSYVSVYRKGSRASYNCAPNCQPIVLPGDDTKVFQQIMSQSKDRDGFASSSNNSGNNGGFR